jgi:hypothetical protein
VAPGAQEVLGGPRGLLRRPDLLDRRRQDHLCRPLLPRAPQALKARQAPETNRNRSIRAPSPKPRPTIFFASPSPPVSETALGHGERQDQRAESEIRTLRFSN